MIACFKFRVSIFQVVEILEEALDYGLDYEPAPFKKPRKRFTKAQLKVLSIESFQDDTGFRSRVANSPLFHHLGDDIADVVEMYRNESCDYWERAAKLIPGHNQACERLIGDLKRSKDIDTLVTLDERRSIRPRSSHKHVNKGLESM